MEDILISEPDVEVLEPRRLPRLFYIYVSEHVIKKLGLNGSMAVKADHLFPSTGESHHLLYVDCVDSRGKIHRITECSRAIEHQSLDGALQRFIEITPQTPQTPQKQNLAIHLNQFSRLMRQAFYWVSSNLAPKYFSLL